MAEQSDNHTLPVLTAAQALQKLTDIREGRGPTAYAMFSSLYGGVVKDSALMVIPIDDHMCHRGHAVFDTATVTDGVLYNAEEHIERFLRSAQQARIRHEYTKEDLFRIVVGTARASGQRSMEIRYWLSAGPGDFSFQPHGCIAPTFYCVAVKMFSIPFSPDGLSEVFVSAEESPMKPPKHATIKSTNYLPNVLLSLTAQDKGGKNGIWVGPDGFVKEGPVSTVVVLDANNVVRSPPLGDVLRSCTLLRITELCVAAGYSVQQTPMTPAEVLQAKELILVGGDKHATSVTRVDGHVIGDGAPGPFWRFILTSLEAAAREGSGRGVRIME